MDTHPAPLRGTLLYILTIATYGIGGYARLAIGYALVPLRGNPHVFQWPLRGTFFILTFATYGIDGYARLAIGYAPAPLRGNPHMFR